MKKIIFVLAALGLSSTAMAALPPYFQSAKEIKAILEHDEVANKLGSGALITSIERHGHAYEIVAGDCMMRVEVEYIAPNPDIAGPISFELNVGQATCLAN